VKPVPRVLEDPAAPLEDRITAAVELGEGDPRPGNFVRVPAGEFWRGSDPPEGEWPEQPRLRARTGTFEIGVVPVTVHEFAAFVRSGYAERELWTEEGWAWKERGAVDRPRFWGDEAWRAYLGPNQPVVGVSWYEAEAYGRFAGARLPSEEEWERAARGEDGRRYPWGEEWDPARAAARGGPRRTLPVGCFPAGRSPHGLLDAAGNVWEWVADAYDPHLHDRILRQDGGLPAPGDRRAARGGAWNTFPPQLRCAHRNAWPPDARYSNIGFRIAR
jgi:formylglycine-generating enzyme required for sulfatase activity